ncbi:MAG: LysE family translocator [Burkholderiales bacterium]|nr:LysE family translocator [Burkholderiales bacterium]
METNVTLSSMAALFGAMAVLAAVPSVSVLAVSARAATGGFAHGAFTAFGVVVGDLVFILFAIFGLTLLAEAMDETFFLVKYLGAAYLIWLGSRLWMAGVKTAHTDSAKASSLASSFMTGLLITLADQKAILFYLGFLPAFLDLPAMSYSDTVIVVAIAVTAVGGVKLAYAWAADRAGSMLGSGMGRMMNIAAGCVMITAGVFVAVRA